MEFIYLVYGLAFFVLGVVSIVLPRQNKAFYFIRHLEFLALFGILHGMVEFIEMLRLNNPAEWLDLLSRLLLLVSYPPLLEFGRRTWNSISNSVRLPASWTYSTVGLGIAVLTLWTASLDGLMAGSRLLVGAPAAMLTGIALHATQRTLRKTYLTKHSDIWLRIVAMAFICYSFSTIFLFQRDIHLPAWLPTQADFLALFGFPVQLLRALCSVMATVGLVLLLRQAGETSQVDATAFGSQESIVITDASRVILRVNQAFSESTGYTAEELVGHKTNFIKQGSYDAAYYAAMWDSINQTGSWRGEVWDQRKNGEIYPKWLNITAVNNTEGVVTHYVGTHIDISEQKQIQQLLQDKDQMLSESQRIGHIGSWSMELVTGCISWSDEMYQIYGVTKETFGHSVKAFLDLIYPGDRDAMKIWISDCLAGKEPQELDFRIMQDDGSVRFIRGSGGLQYDESKRPLRIVGSAQDISERKQAEQVLHQIKAMIDSSLDGFWIVDFMGNVLQVNKAYAEISGYSIDELMNMHISQLEALEGSDQVKAHISKIVTQGYDLFETRHRHKDGHTIDIEVSASFLPEYQQFCVFCRDITERKRIESDLCIAATAFESQEGMFVTDAHKVILRVNRAFTKITGYTAEDVIGKNPRILKSGRHDADFYAAMWESINGSGAWEGEIWNRRKTGEVYPEHLTITAVIVADGIVSNYVATLTDITLSKAAADEVERLAFYDPLTGLPNRRLLWDRLNSALSSSHRSGRKGALLFIDMDNFKTLNDTLGHDIGDLMLQQVAQRLEPAVREGDTVARLGGDEFVVMLEDLSEQALEAAAQTKVIGNKILATLNQPYQLATHDYQSTFSIGVTLFNGHELSAEELMKQADIAMYHSKSSGRNALRFFDPQMQASISARVSLEGELRKALEKQQFQLHYQIQVDSLGYPVGAEALIRLLDTERVQVSPAQFIPLAEETGLILPIGQWVLETACAQLNAWQQNALTCDLMLAVNVSAKQYRQAGFVNQVLASIDRHAINPKLLKLELTESMLLDDIEGTIATMNTLGEIGVQFSLDDFGTGYSSLQYLKRLPLYQLKIDQSFVRDIAYDMHDRSIVRTIIAMAKSMDLKVIAEGVETEEQRFILLNNGCTHYQGYLFGKPIPIKEFEKLLKLG